MKYFIKDNYYFDIDQFNQLRITGPDNHLLLGLLFPNDAPVEITRYDVRDGQLVISIKIDANHLVCPIPLVTDIRTLRSLVEPVQPKPTYRELLLQQPNLVRPREIKKRTSKDSYGIRFVNTYEDESGDVKSYGSELLIPKEYDVILSDHTVEINHTESPLELKIRTIQTARPKLKIRKKIFSIPQWEIGRLLDPELFNIFEESQRNTEHLIKANKTSSFEYGTIFPRDWIESADLGDVDLTQSTIDYMYEQAMSFISEEGEGWHENIVGDFRRKVDPSQHIDRKMIDIEPHYILGIRVVSKHFLTLEENRQKLSRVAKYIIRKATENDLISFKRSQEGESFEMVGNWRDSVKAFPNYEGALHPYDVNCVFYPISLKLIRAYHEFFQVEDPVVLDELIAKWDLVKNKYRMYHPEGLIGYALAVFGSEARPLAISHLDESYDLFYGVPSLEETVSFAKKIIDPNYFYTPSGPMLVSARETELSTSHYHGKVIWPKQAAYAVAGLTKQYKRGVRDVWPFPVMETIKQSIIATCEACFRGWREIGFVPELYYFDESNQQARLFTDQPVYEGQMSTVQLWSAIGCRRIMLDYIYVTQPLEVR